MEFLKSILKPETYAALESEINDYCNSHDEKIRLVNVSDGEYVSKKKLEKAEREKTQLQETIDSLNASLSEKDTDAEEQMKKLKEQIDAFKEENAQREAAQKMAERFSLVKGSNEFINSFTENGVREAFFAALGNGENQGKSDSEIFNSVVAALGDVYKNPHKPSDIPPMGDVDPVLDAEKFKTMSLDEQMKFANTHSEQYHNLFKE